MKKDKLQHFGMGMVLVLVSWFCGLGPLGAFKVVVTVAFIKELLDLLGQFNKTNPLTNACDPYDFLWTVSSWVAWYGMLSLIGIYCFYRF
jgi:hypothetical protein